MTILRVPLLTTICFLVLATSASAECAWALWVEESWLAFYKQDERPATWTLVQAHPLLAKCEQAQTEKIQVLAKGEDTRISANIISKTFPGGHNDTTRIQQLRVICVPDTIDPRGPKGK